MAEAAVEEPMPPVNPRFFCHNCKVEVSHMREDFTCPTCEGGFIEELESTPSASDDTSDDHSDEDMYDIEGETGDMLSRFGEIIFGLSHETGRQGRDRALRLLERSNIEDHGRSRWHRRGGDNPPFEHMIQDIIMNLTGVGWAGGGRQGGSDGPNGPFFFLGNPGDYAWGREGLDAIVTQLLNQIDVAGPPPLDEARIETIPKVQITQIQIDTGLQCSVCWEDFSLEEEVRKLPCEHLYHDNCIVPWLKLHGTCPVCRKSLSDESERPPTSLPNLGPISGVVPEFLWRDSSRPMTTQPSSSSSNTSTSSSSSSSDSSTSTSSSSQRSSYRNPFRRSDSNMDFEFD